MALKLFQMKEEDPMNRVALVIEPRKNDLGDGFTVRRLLPYAKKRLIGPFIFWDHMGPVTLSAEKEMKVRAHPHIGLSTLTYLLSGEIMHRDSLQNEQVIRPGEINWMVSGKWISHSERSRPEQPMKLEGIQVWVALPKDKEDIEPSFSHHGAEELPTLKLGEIPARLIAGDYERQRSPLSTFSPLFYLHGQARAGDLFQAQIPPSQEGAVYVVHGALELNGQVYPEGTMICFDGAGPVEGRMQQAGDLMFFGGQPFEEKRFIFWNLVSSSEEKIEKAKQKWLSGNYEPVINETEFIPLPPQ
jgi:redox-sensitive bicupin YhaK (pirin superfamily)